MAWRSCNSDSTSVPTHVETVRDLAGQGDLVTDPAFVR